MRRWTRREVLQSGAAAAAGATLGPSLGAATPAQAAAQTPSVAPASAGVGPREQLLLDFGWRFELGHAADPDRDLEYGRGRMFAKSGQLFTASGRDFDARAWRAVDLPHDWAVELPFRENVPELVEFGSKPLGRAYPETSIGWYRRTLEIPASDAGRRLVLRFDGVFRDAVVAWNGHYLGRNLSGYAPFEYDVSDVVDYGGSNVLVVRVDATGREGWFYEGAGIYRHAWLLKTSPLHVARWGTFVRSALARGSATLSIATQVDNDSDQETSCVVVQAVVDATGTIVASVRSAAVSVPAWSRSELKQQVDVRDPALWSPDTPALYRLVTTLESGGTSVDRYETSFGIRSVAFDAEKGFLLNGAPLVLKGTCNHQDHAGVGAALPDRVQAYRIERLKEMGSNAYRASHNPPTPELLDACDRLGMLVLDETRMFTPTDEGLGQLERLILRDRNHPSVFSWSIANEEWSDQGNVRGTRIAAALTRLAHRLDPSRPVSAAMDGSWGAGIALAVDVQGCNYERPRRPETNLDTFHERFPKKPKMGSEVASTYCTRGVYAVDKAKGYVTAYDVDRPDYGATAEGWWSFFATRPHLSGGFVWTGFDYRGEPSPYGWPCISSHFGIMDVCGFPKDNFFYYKAWWGKDPVLHLFPHWNWRGKEGAEIDVWVHSNLERVELLLNGTSLGSRDVERHKHLSWKVPFAPGTLEARGSRGGRVVLRAAHATTGAPVRIALRADRPQIAADGEDVSMITVFVLDAKGRAVPTADNEIAFEVTGKGKLIGVGNGDPSSHEADKGTTRRLFGGLCAAIVQSAKQAGELRVAATAPGLQPATLVITCTAAPARPTA
jgi:beta-galactosidase